MLKQVGYSDIKAMLRGAIELVCLKCDELSSMDAVIGDGDHGVTMLRAMQKTGQVIDEHGQDEIAALLGTISWELLCIDGGATGPLYGSLFGGMAEAVQGKTVLDGKDLAAMFEGGLEALQQQTAARVGDKTMMDALIPAVLALRAAAEQEKNIRTMLEEAAAAALAGAEATKKIPARFGRAKFQGARTIGHPDPGSVSMALIFQGFVNGLVG